MLVLRPRDCQMTSVTPSVVGEVEDERRVVGGELPLAGVAVDQAPAQTVGHRLRHVGEVDAHPAVLVEGGFLTNSEELHKLATGEYREQLAVAISDGVMRYREVLKGQETPLAVDLTGGE